MSYNLSYIDKNMPVVYTIHRQTWLATYLLSLVLVDYRFQIVISTRDILADYANWSAITLNKYQNQYTLLKIVYETLIEHNVMGKPVSK